MNSRATRVISCPLFDMSSGKRGAAGLYDSPRLAAGYAHFRPPVHPHVIRMAAERLGITKRLARALDVGCGAGRSADALGELAESVVGIEPVHTMLAYGRTVAPCASFVVGQAEALPFPSCRFDLITAAGSLNYVELERFFAEAARVLAPVGKLIIYDFSVGRRFGEGDALDEWFAAFERRYPFPPDHDIDARSLDYGRSGLRLCEWQVFEVSLSYSHESYVEYVLTEANVEQAIRQGSSEVEIRDWCRRTLEGVFGGTRRDVLFGGYVAYICREAI
jgi:ubiquinone/menaquinone biosynthesis C-methylase UbiE